MESAKNYEDTQQRTEEEENDQEMAQLELGDDENQEKIENKNDVLGPSASLDDSNIEKEPENVSKKGREVKRRLESDGEVDFESEPATNAKKEMGFQNMTQVGHTGLSSQTNPPVNIDLGSGRKRKSRGLQQGYCVVPSAKRFIVLYSFLKRKLSKKVMVFFSSCNSVKYHSELLRHSEIDCFDIHGKQKQLQRTSYFLDFCKAENGILLCNDVAACGLDIPSVDWIIQYDPPYEYKEFIDRVYRTTYREGAKETNVLLFLSPEELQFCHKLKVCHCCSITEN
ncbi:DEAD-box ATP-dependent RNA helicase 27-like isoform X2 [Olea europaea var. sylvestris]|uniref:DEAD-box ATP-dependent RNA helicase 27-like isoform X2 n=1 Tax=Olea europaea var. sylvestris TaxID=158386 RepID=UPI000C1D826E|nr:DEAD-box ATP-dependent RNA helicase 27-like isoform X2 [Olea europaea var. sylvestris]